ncbi:MAG: Gfo/Idh/MocA family oxidoreductase [Treponema sp.]|nr:Gfo/Idh/MocA family oxidoreductase [Treponema sp.]
MLTVGRAPLRIGIVGAGAMAEYHVRRFSGIAGVRVAAVCDHSEAKAREFAAANGIGRFFAHPADMAASRAVDAVSVAAYDGYHREPVLAALDRGLPVFCEKPLARRLSDAAAMAEAAARAGVPALVNFSKRNGGLLSLARRLIESGHIGTPRTAEFHYRQSWLLQDAWGDWRRSPRWAWRLSESLSTFGALGDLGSHVLDALLLVLGPGEVGSCSARRFDAPSESGVELTGGPSFDSFSARISAGAVEASVSGSYRAEGHLDSFGLNVGGDAAALDLDFDRSRSTLLKFDAPGATGVPVEAEKVPSTYERFLAMARGGEDPVEERGLDFERGLEVQDLVEACAAASGAAADR